MPETLKDRLARRGWEDCTCPWERQSLGRLYGISFGKGWVRLATAPGCPCHDTASADEAGGA